MKQMHEDFAVKKPMRFGVCGVGLLLGSLGVACGSSPEPAPEPRQEEVAAEQGEAPEEAASATTAPEVPDSEQPSAEAPDSTDKRTRAMEGLGPLRFGMSREEAMSWVESHPRYAADTVPYDFGFENDRLSRIALLPQFLNHDVFVAGRKIEPGMNREAVARLFGDCDELVSAEGGNFQTCYGGLIRLTESPGNSDGEPFRQDVRIVVTGEALGPAVLRMAFRGEPVEDQNRIAEVHFDAGDAQAIDVEVTMAPGFSTSPEEGIGGLATLHAGIGHALFAERVGDEVRLLRRVISEDGNDEQAELMHTFELPAHRTLRLEPAPRSGLNCSEHRVVARCNDGPTVCVAESGMRMSVSGPGGSAVYDAPLDRLLRYSFASPQNSRSVLRVGLPTPWHFLVGPDGELSVQRGTEEVACRVGEQHMEVFVGLLSADSTSFPY